MSERRDDPQVPAPEIGSRYRATVVVDGKPLPLKPFLHDMIGSASYGLIETLRGVESPRGIEIRIEKL